jgi:hypothetical protein
MKYAGFNSYFQTYIPKRLNQTNEWSILLINVSSLFRATKNGGNAAITIIKPTVDSNI